MRKTTARIVTVAALAAFCCLALSGCGTEDMDEGTRTALGIGLGIMIVLASAGGFMASGRYFGRKRQANQRRNRQRAKSKSKKRKR